MERAFLIVTESPGGRPFVLAESVDICWLDDETSTWWPSVALTEQEAMLDPDLGPVVTEYLAGDHRGYAACRAMEQADDALSDTEAELSTEGIEAFPEDETKEWGTGAIAQFLEIMGDEPHGLSHLCTLLKQLRLDPADPVQEGEWWIDAIFGAYLERIEETQGKAQADRWARRVTQQLRQKYVWGRGREAPRPGL
jgi:hypothetical protein